MTSTEASVVELPRTRPLADPIAPDDPRLPADPEWDEDEVIEPETRLCHAVNPRNRALSLCGLTRPVGSPSFKGDPRTWLDCPECWSRVVAR